MSICTSVCIYTDVCMYVCMFDVLHVGMNVCKYVCKLHVCANIAFHSKI